MPCSTTDLPRAGRGTGFTLIELMVTVVVVAILASIAYPSYLKAVRKAKRAEAQALLLEIMQQQERYYTQRNTYIAFTSASTDPDAKRFKWFSGSTPAKSAYEIRAGACDNDLQECVKLSAIPGTQAVDSGYADPECGTLILTSTGERGAEGEACWD